MWVVQVQTPGHGRGQRGPGLVESERVGVDMDIDGEDAHTDVGRPTRSCHESGRCGYVSGSHRCRK